LFIKFNLILLFILYISVQTAVLPSSACSSADLNLLGEHVHVNISNDDDDDYDNFNYEFNILEQLGISFFK